MSDSDDDLLQNNVFTFQNEHTTICARGPNFSNANINGLNCRNNLPPVMHNMSVNYERQRYAGSNFDQRSLYHRRETSPMSLSSMPDFRYRNFNHSMFRNGMRFQRPVFNGRDTSPRSVRSVDTTSSVSAADIVFALKNVKFDKHDVRLIKEAVSKFIKTSQRRRIEKRRKHRLPLKGARYKSGDDSGEQGSNSSISSNDCRSLKSTIYKENISGIRHLKNIPDFNRNIRENQIFRDCTDNIKQNTVRNMFSSTNIMLNNNTKEKVINTSVIETHSSAPAPATLKERFKQGFPLPSQRFNKSVTDQNHAIGKDSKSGSSKNYIAQNVKQVEPEGSSDDDEIFRGFPQTEAQKEINNVKKRILDIGDACQSNNKRRKINLSQNIQMAESIDSRSNLNTSITNSNDFIFAKPKMPVKKGNVKKGVGTEILLAKSNVPSTAMDDEINKSMEKEDKDIEDNTQATILHSTTDMSMRPSFIKRKLFSQKLDVAESKNTSLDSVTVNSPKNVYSLLSRERSKARKLVTSQSCLSREVIGEDNNVIDLIHKIVPPNQMNMTNVTNKTQLSNNNKSNNVDKWDISKYISNSNDYDISDTYTDEEIFTVNNVKVSNAPKNSTLNTKQSCPKQTKVVIEKLNPQVIDKHLKKNDMKLKQNDIAQKEPNKKYDCIRSFWDTDFESDLDLNDAPTWKTRIQKDHDSVPIQRSDNVQDKVNCNKKPLTSKGTILSVRNYHKDNIQDFSIKSQNNKEIIKQVSDNLNVKNNDEPILRQDKDDKTKNVKGTKATNTNSRVRNKRKCLEKENDLVTNGIQELGKRCKEIPNKIHNSVDCNNHKTRDTPRNLKETAKNSLKVNSTMKTTKNTLNNSKNSTKLIQDSKKNKINSLQDAELAKKATYKIGKSINNTNTRSDLEANNIRKQPARKSKEKSFVLSHKIQKNTMKSKEINNNPNTKTAKELPFKNITINSINTRSTRSSRDKMSVDSSMCDESSLDICTMSRRSRRLQQRHMNERKKCTTNT